MAKHITKTGHRLSKALANRERNSLTPLQAATVASEQFIVELEVQEDQIENVPNKARRKFGDGRWEQGFKLIDGFYHIRLQKGGVRRCINLKTNKVTVARERRMELWQLLKDAQHFNEHPEMTVAQLYEKYQRSATVDLAEGTMRARTGNWKNHILPLIGDMLCSKVTNQVVTELLGEYLGLYEELEGEDEGDEEDQEEGDVESGTGGRTKKPRKRNKGGANSLLTDLKVVFYWGLANGYLGVMPFTKQKFRLQKITRPFVAFPEIHPFLEAMKQHSDDPEARELQGCQGIFLGMRSNEIRLTRRHWIDFEQATLTPMETKGREAVPIPVPRFLLAKLRAYCDSRNIGPNALLYCNTDGKSPVSRGFLRNPIKMAALAIGKPTLRPHGMRRTFATLHAYSGTPVRVIQAMLRHKTILTTLLYIQDVPELNRHAQRRLEILSGFSGLGEDQLNTLRPWGEDLAESFGGQAVTAPKTLGTPILSAALESELKEMLRELFQAFTAAHPK